MRNRKKEIYNTENWNIDGEEQNCGAWNPRRGCI